MLEGGLLPPLSSITDEDEAVAKKQSRTNNQNTKARRTTKADRKAIGEANAPSVVPAPKHECIVCQKKKVLTLPLQGVRICEKCQEKAEARMRLVIGGVPLMIDDLRWSADFLMTIWQEWMEHEVRALHNAFWDKNAEVWRPLGALGIIERTGPQGFNSAAHIYLAARGVHRLNSKYNNYTVGNHAWYSMAMSDWFKRKRVADDNARLKVEKPEGNPKPENREEALEKVAMKKAPIPPGEVDEMVEAIEYAIANWDNKDARKLPSDYQIYKSPGVPTGCKPLVEPAPANIIQWIVFKHKKLANRVIVGMTNLKTGKMEFSGRRGEIRDYMIKVKSPQRLHHPKLGQISEKANSRSNGEAKNKKRLGVPPGASKAIPVSGD